KLSTNRKKVRTLLYNSPCKVDSRFFSGALLTFILLQPGCSYMLQVKKTDTHEQATTDSLLALLHEFSTADAQDRAATYERISTTAVLEPDAYNRLQLALLKAWPGHPGHNPEAARQMLQTALNARRELTPGTEILAQVYLSLLEQQQQTVNRNRILETELEAARSKLEAMTKIERTVETPASRSDIEIEPVKTDAQNATQNPDSGR
ncbi:MAG TPA: hypothetical protein VGL10_09285, partial [Gammaproteobacteria bacterium]